MTTPRFLVFAASTREGSFNKRLADFISRKLTHNGAQVTPLDLRDYPLPLYDGDLEARSGVPVEGERLHALFCGHDGIFIASPEYNANVTPLLANVLAWISRVTEHGGMAAAFGHPVFALGSASPGGFGGYRGLMALRQSLELQLGARVLPTMVSIGAAHEAFDNAGELSADSSRRMADRVIRQLLDATA